MQGVFSFVSCVNEPMSAVLCASLARSLAARGKRVLILDLSPVLPMLDFLLGVADRVIYTLSDLGKVPFEDVLLSPELNGKKGKSSEGKILFAPAAYGETPDFALISSLIETQEADVVLLSLDRTTAPLARGLSEGMLFLAQTEEAFLRAQTAFAQELAFDGFVLTDFLPTVEAVRREMPLSALIDALALPLLGILPRIDLKNTDSYRGKDFLCAVENITSRLLGHNIPLLRGIAIDGMRRRTYFERTTR